jgi:hypothetical protein
VPRYTLEIREPDGGLTTGEHESPEGVWYDTGHRFEHSGRNLRVALLEDSHGPYDQKLVCTPE